MDQELHSPKKVLVAPLDWGLGHATRSIPIINQLLKAGCEVILAGDGKVRSLLRKEFPQLEFLHLKGYNISYGKNKWELVGKILLQIPKLIETIDEENEWLQQVVETDKIDAVISDSRFGLNNQAIESIFITHQLQIKTSIGSFADDILQKLNYQHIEEFDECWVPDYEDQFTLAGELSHPKKLPDVPVKYIGALTRFKKNEQQTEVENLLIILSGPEPQRTILEDVLLSQLENYNKHVTLVRGLPDSENSISTPHNVTPVNHLPAVELQNEIENANFVISRCGYSTVMDLAALQKKAILIPTPGQTEQEYLAVHLMKKKLALCLSQTDFNLENALHLAESFEYKFTEFNADDQLAMAVNSLLQKLDKKKIKMENFES